MRLDVYSHTHTQNLKLIMEHNTMCPSLPYSFPLSPPPPPTHSLFTSHLYQIPPHSLLALLPSPPLPPPSSLPPSLSHHPLTSLPPSLPPSLSHHPPPSLPSSLPLPPPSSLPPFLYHHPPPSLPSSLTISWLLKVDVGVPEGPPGDLVAADSDGDDWPRLAELLVKRSLVHFGVKVTDVEGSNGETGLARGGVHLGVFGWSCFWSIVVGCFSVLPLTA